MPERFGTRTFPCSARRQNSPAAEKPMAMANPTLPSVSKPSPISFQLGGPGRSGLVKETSCRLTTASSPLSVDLHVVLLGLELDFVALLLALVILALFSLLGRR